MPTSQLNQLNEIMELIIELKPKSILDVGVGFGKYGFLAREYLDIWGREEHDYRDWGTKIDGIEVFEKYLTPVHEFIYDNIFIGNALDIIPILKNRYDLILLIDVLEHFDFKEGSKILSECKIKGRNILISTPRDVGDQGPSRGNIFETHKFQWTKKHLDIFPKKIFVPNKISLIYFIGEDTKLLEAKLKNRNSKIRLKLKKKIPRIYKSYLAIRLLFFNK